MMEMRWHHPPTTNHQSHQLNRWCFPPLSLPACNGLMEDSDQPIKESSLFPTCTCSTKTSPAPWHTILQGQLLRVPGLMSPQTIGFVLKKYKEPRWQICFCWTYKKKHWFVLHLCWQDTSATYWIYVKQRIIGQVNIRWDTYMMRTRPSAAEVS